MFKPLVAFFFIFTLSNASSAEPKGIVTLGAGVTETVFALGLGGDVVGVDVSSLHPPAAHKKPKVGYVRATTAEGIASLNPKLVLASSILGPPTIHKQLKDAGLRLELVKAPTSIEDALERISQIGKLLRKEAGAKKLADSITAKVAEAKAYTQGKKAKRILCVFVHGGASMLIAGRGTAANVMIEAAGAVNAVNGYEGYKPLTAEALLVAKPDIVLATTRSLKATGGKMGLWKSPGLKLTPAGEKQALIVMDDLKLMGFGPRTGEAVLELSKAIYP